MWRRSSSLRHHLHRLLSPSPIPSPPSLLPFSRSLSTSSPTTPPPSDLARSIAADLAKLSSASPSSQSLDLHSHLNLHYSDITFNQALFRDILSLSPPATSAGPPPISSATSSAIGPSTRPTLPLRFLPTISPGATISSPRSTCFPNSTKPLAP